MPAPPSTLILVVDDYDDTRAMYAEYLESIGYRVEQAADGAAGLRKAIELVPDLVLMDLTLPVMDGWEATRQLRAHPRTKHVAIIALTGHAGPMAAAAAEAGCDSCLSKPCLPDVLVAEVQRLLGRKG